MGRDARTRCEKLRILVELKVAEAIEDEEASEAAQLKVAKKHGIPLCILRKWGSTLKRNGINAFLGSNTLSSSFRLYIAQRHCEKRHSFSVIERDTGVKRYEIQNCVDKYLTTPGFYDPDEEEIEATQLLKELSYTPHNTRKPKAAKKAKKAKKSTKSAETKAEPKEAVEEASVPEETPVQTPLPYAEAEVQAAFQRLNLPNELADRLIEVVRDIQAHADSQIPYEVARLQEEMKAKEDTILKREKRIRELNTEKDGAVAGHAALAKDVADLKWENSALIQENAELKPSTGEDAEDIGDVGDVDISKISFDASDVSSL